MQKLRPASEVAYGAQRVLQANGEAAAAAMGSGSDFELWIKHGSEGAPTSAEDTAAPGEDADMVEAAQQ